MVTLRCENDEIQAPIYQTRESFGTSLDISGSGLMRGGDGTLPDKAALAQI